HGRGRKFYYACLANCTRGRRACQNALPLPMEAADETVLRTFHEDLLRPEVIESALRQALEQSRPGNELETRRATLNKSLDETHAELARLATAVAQDGNLVALVEAMRERERKRDHIRQELLGLEGLERIANLDWHRVSHALREKLTDWQGLLVKHTP